MSGRLASQSGCSRRVREKKTTHNNTFCLLSLLFLTSCAGAPEPLSLEKRQQLGKVYLSSTGSTGETFFQADFDNGGAGGSISGAGKGAVNGLDGCVNSALGAGGLAPLVFLICTPIMVTKGMAAGTQAGGVQAIPDETLADLEQQTKQVLQQADLSPALVATLDDVSQKQAALAPYEISHGILPPPDNGHTVNEVAASWGYQTVMEIQVTQVGLDGDDGKTVVPMMHLAMTANVKLIDAKSGSVLYQQDYHYNSTSQSVAVWVREDYRNLIRELALANRVLASTIIENVFTGSIVQ